MFQNVPPAQRVRPTTSALTPVAHAPQVHPIHATRSHTVAGIHLLSVSVTPVTADNHSSS